MLRNNYFLTLLKSFRAQQFGYTVSAYCIDTGRAARAAQGIPGNDLTREIPLIFFFFFLLFSLSLENLAIVSLCYAMSR